MRFLVDDSTGSAVVAYLRAAGHDGLAVAETLPEADDQYILGRAMSEQRILITNHQDFATSSFGVGKRIMASSCCACAMKARANRARIVKELLKRYADRLTDHFTVATEAGVRIRPRPWQSSHRMVLD